MLTNYVNNAGNNPRPGPYNDSYQYDQARRSESDITAVEKRLEEKLREMEEHHEEQRRLENEKRELEMKIILAQKRAKYEKHVRRKYDLMINVYEKWKNDRVAKFEELQQELTKIVWSEQVHSLLSARLEFVKEAHSYSFGMCDQIGRSIRDKSEEINPEKRHAKLTTKLTILLENFEREREIAESEYGCLTRLVKMFFDAFYLSRIQVYFLEVAKGADQMHGMVAKIKDQLSLLPAITDEILESWDEFKKIFDEFDNDVDNDGPKLDEIGRIVSQRLALMAAAASHQPLPHSPKTETEHTSTTATVTTPPVAEVAHQTHPQSPKTQTEAASNEATHSVVEVEHQPLSPKTPSEHTATATTPPVVEAAHKPLPQSPKILTEPTATSATPPIVEVVDAARQLHPQSPKTAAATHPVVETAHRSELKSPLIGANEKPATTTVSPGVKTAACCCHTQQHTKTENENRH